MGSLGTAKLIGAFIQGNLTLGDPTWENHTLAVGLGNLTLENQTLPIGIVNQTWENQPLPIGNLTWENHTFPLGNLTWENQTLLIGNFSSGNLTGGNETLLKSAELVRRSSVEIGINAFVLLLILMVALFGNMAVIFAVFSYRRLREQLSNLFIVNLAITDMTSALVVMLTTVVTIMTDVTSVNSVWCNITCAANYVLIIVSMLTLAFISVDRFYAILHPLHYTTIITQRKILIMMAYTWFQGIAFALPPVCTGWIHYDYWEVICAIDWQKEKEKAVYYVIVACVACFLIPGVVMTFCYIKIAIEAKRSIEATAPAPSNIKGRKSPGEHTRKVINSLLVVVAIFFICLTPFCITKFLKVISDTNIVPPYANLAASWFQYICSATNPLIYGIFRKDFRKAYKQQCWRITCRLANISWDDSAAWTTSNLKRRISVMAEFSVTNPATLKRARASTQINSPAIALKRAIRQSNGTVSPEKDCPVRPEKDKIVSPEKHCLTSPVRNCNVTTDRDGAGSPSQVDLRKDSTPSPGVDCTKSIGKISTASPGKECSEIQEKECTTVSTGKECTFSTGKECRVSTGKKLTDSTVKACIESKGKKLTDSTGKECRESTGKEFTDSKRKDSRVSSGKDSKVSTGKDSRVSTGKDSRVNSGKDSRGSTGKDCRVSSGKDSRVSTGNDSGVSSAKDSRVSTGKDSRVSSGKDSRVSTGNGSGVSSAKDSRVSTGKDSRVSSGKDSRVSTGNGSGVSSAKDSRGSTGKDSRVSSAKDSRGSTGKELTDRECAVSPGKDRMVNPTTDCTAIPGRISPDITEDDKPTSINKETKIWGQTPKASSRIIINWFCSWLSM